MKVSYNWLKQYVDLTGITPEELADRLTSSGLEVEGVEKTAHATKLVIRKMLECKDHPNSDHLHICKVDTGNGVSQIVCGAPNAMEAVGKKVIVALPGCELPGGTIRESKVRGEDSAGMICALFELGVDKKSLSEKQLHGIEILDDDAPLGETNVLGYLGLDDTVLDVSLTPNRADCLAMWSLAKQTGAVLNRPVYLPEEYKSPEELPATATIRIETDKCAWFLGKVVHKVKLGPSPEWIRKALQANGVKSINNLVDISNLVMLETGQPLHYYDLKKIQDREITVKQGLNEVYTALDDIEYKIEPEDIMITNKGRAVGIAGIMGGDDSKIDETTEAILIEAACFDHVCVRNTSLRLNLQTEAAQRFIKMIEPQAGVKAMWRSVELLTKYADAEGIEETVVAGNLIDGVKTISLTRSKVNAVLGTNFTMEEILDPLKRLCFNPRTEGETITVTIPSYRYNDISLPEDVIEDIIQVKGYDNIKGTLPEMPQTIGGLEPMNKMSRTVKKYLKGCGLHEIYSYSLVGQNVLNMGVLPLGEAIPLLNPLSDERKYYRTSLAGSMLENVSYNMAHSASDFGLFETAKVYAEGKEEETRLSVALTGKLIQSAWKKAEVESDYYAIKGIVY
ncbi:MAG: phenylalanine--tRNA ligase subunit beta [Erysipelotrichales bacterium]|nr:phenylalanine--tRNA ligase subunit beta [Erysipelotrichales bacterium]